MGNNTVLLVIPTLQAIQDSEINFQILTFWDSGFTIQLGDHVNGIVAEIDFEQLQDGVNWLVGAVLEHFPKSKFACEYQGKKWPPG